MNYKPRALLLILFITGCARNFSEAATGGHVERKQASKSIACGGEDSKWALTLEFMDIGSTHDKRFHFVIKQQDTVALEDSWVMKQQDFNELLLQEGNLTPQAWLDGIFGDALQYGISLKCEHVTSDQLQTAVIEYYCQTNGCNLENVKQELLGDHMVVSYRKTWSEDLLIAAYLPAMQRFVPFSRGDY